MKINGGCHCGNIQYKAEIDENKVILCHCTDCQQMSGAPFRGIVVTTGDKFSLTGNLKAYIKETANSGNPRTQSFCPECGTHIYATSVEKLGIDEPVDRSKKMYNVRLGTVQQKDKLKPTMEIWCDSREAWLEPVEGTKQFATGPQ